MNINDITFGIEIETHIPAGAIPVGHHGNGLDITALPGQTPGTFWKADRDPSIRCAAGREACEFVSPVLKGTDGLTHLIAALRTIKSLGAQVNSSCGIHVHVGFDKSDSAASARLASLVANFEKAIFAATGTKNRERGRWSRGLARYTNPVTAITASRRDRYHVANFATVKPTVEFRAFSASLNPAKIVAYIRLSVALVERAAVAKRPTNWTAKTPVATSPIHRNGEGQTALNRLFYQLGWTKGRQPHTFGNLTGPGLSAITATKKTLVQLARKYDAQL